MCLYYLYVPTAGDYVKFGLPMAYTTTVTSWGVVDHKEGYIEASTYLTVMVNDNFLRITLLQQSC
jgi:hypothetical protein